MRMTNGSATVPILTPEMIEEYGLHASDVAVWYALCSFARWKRVHGKPSKTEEGSCFPTASAIAGRIGDTEKTVYRALKKLETIGLIVRTRRHGKNGERRSNDYILLALEDGKNEEG